MLRASKKDGGGRQDWGTPQWLYDAINEVWPCVLDVRGLRR